MALGHVRGVDELQRLVALRYGNDVRAPNILNAIIKVIYPDGKPVSASEDCAGGCIVSPEHSACLSLIEEIENLIREGGFGPQVGKNELERLADV